MEEKLRFIFEYQQGDKSMTELCRQYGISRETGYVTLRRYEQTGVAGLVKRSRAAERHNNQTPAEIERIVLELRQAHMRWGPRKLKRVLERDEPGRVWPAASTIGAMLKREGLVVGRRKRIFFEESAGAINQTDYEPGPPQIKSCVLCSLAFSFRALVGRLLI
jgi:transposase-like protein